MNISTLNRDELIAELGSYGYHLDSAGADECDVSETVADLRDMLREAREAERIARLQVARLHRPTHRRDFHA